VAKASKEKISAPVSCHDFCGENINRTATSKRSPATITQADQSAWREFDENSPLSAASVPFGMIACFGTDDSAHERNLAASLG
jgi:hypothetical protein